MKLGQSLTIKKNMLLILGFGGSQIITILALPFITNLYDPEAFGIYSYHIVILSFLGYIASFRLNLKLQLDENNEDIKNTCYFLAMIFSIFVFFATLIIFKSLILSFLYFFSVLFLNFFEINTDYSSSKRNYKDIAKSNILRVVIVVSVQIFLHDFKYGLFIGFLSGLVISQIAIYSFRLIPINIDLHSLDRSFMLKNTLISLVTISGSSIPLILVYNYESILDAGLFSLADKLVLTLIVIINNISSRLIYNDLNGESSHSLVFKYWCIRLLIISFLLVSSILIIPDQLFYFVFSDSWGMSFQYLKSLLPWFVTQVVLVPLTCVYIKNGLERNLIKLEFFKNFLRIIAIIIFYKANLSTQDVMIFSSVATAIFSFIVFFGSYKKNAHIFC